MKQEGTSDGEFDACAIVDMSVRAQVDPRTFLKRLRGLPVRGLAGARIDRVLAQARAARGSAVSSRRDGDGPEAA